MREKSVHMVSVLDLTKDKEGVIEFMKKSGVYEGGEVIRTFGKLGVVENAGGKHFLSNDEGCGSGVALETLPDTIDWYVDIERDGYKAIGISPRFSSNYSLADVLALPVLETISLDAFVRVFGDRLERNLANWNSFLDKDVES